jgi:hypothetical protein
MFFKLIHLICNYKLSFHFSYLDILLNIDADILLNIDADGKLTIQLYDRRGDFSFVLNIFYWYTQKDWEKVLTAY